VEAVLEIDAHTSEQTARGGVCIAGPGKKGVKTISGDAMKRHIVNTAICGVTALLLALPAAAQNSNKLTFYVGGGFTEPVKDTMDESIGATTSTLAQV
jgi:hypothetical protein